MKPLELTTFHLWESQLDGTVYADIPGERFPERVEWRVLAKRLSDAELAAEYWRLRLKVCSRGNRDVKGVGHPCVEWRAAHDECDTLHRFATNPHYDEADS